MPRDLIVLLDTSGSMCGTPLEQARRVVGGAGRDARRRGPARADRVLDRPAPLEARARGRDGRRADGGAGAGSPGSRPAAPRRWAQGIAEALAPLRADAQRQVVLVTDGQIGFEPEVVAAVARACRRARGCTRWASAPRSTARSPRPAARAGRGVEVVIGLGEDAERGRAAARRAHARAAPDGAGARGLGAVGHAPARLPDLFAGAPALVGVALRPEGGELRARPDGRGRLGRRAWTCRRSTPAKGTRPSPRSTAARPSRTSSSARAGGEAAARRRDRAPRARLPDRDAADVVGRGQRGADGRSAQPRRRERMPHELPHGLSAEGLGLRGATAMASVSRRPRGSPAPGSHRLRNRDARGQTTTWLVLDRQWGKRISYARVTPATRPAP